MTLTAGRGPFSVDPAGWFSTPIADDLVFVEPHPRRVQAGVHADGVARAGLEGTPERLEHARAIALRMLAAL